MKETTPKNVGKLLVLEGLDAAGKSTQVKLMSEHYVNMGKTVKTFHFPTYTHNEFGKVITSFLQGDFGKSEEVNPYFVANIYAMDRFLFKEELTSMLQKNDVVILDRYVFSNAAFQGAKFSNDSVESNKIRRWILNFEFDFLQLPQFDLCLYMNVPMTTIEKRLTSERVGQDRDYLNGKADIHEADINLQRRVHENYMKLEGTYSNYRVVNCYDFSPEEIFETYKDLL